MDLSISFIGLFLALLAFGALRYSGFRPVHLLAKARYFDHDFILPGKGLGGRGAHADRITASGISLGTTAGELGELESLPPSGLAPEALRKRLDTEGYVLARGALPPERVSAARDAVLFELQRLGCVAPGVPTGDAPQNGALAYKRVFSQLGKLPEVRAVLDTPELVGFFENLLEGPVRRLDSIRVRMVPPGCATDPHCDIVYMGRGTQRLYTSWITLFDVPRSNGGLMILERSHQLNELEKRYWKLDVDRDDLWDRVRLRHWRLVREGKYSSNPRGVQREFGRRWLTTDYGAGDVAVFSAFTMHATLDNVSDRIRVTIDANWQRADEPADERWIGEDPPGHGPRSKVGYA